ncbi:MAG: type I pullulanase [Mediterranea sp.]|jgi:pullulanase|nr:type I pullulanase [Mediterranea sp.]
MRLNNLAVIEAAAIMVSCSSGNMYNSYDDYPVRSDNLIEMVYNPTETLFMLWAPTADDVRVMLFDQAENSSPSEMIRLERNAEGTWTGTAQGDRMDKFYAFNVKVDNKWLGETPGINARAVGVNGKRAAIINNRATNPPEWENDRRPELRSQADMIIYEMHHRDFSIHESSGIQHKGKYLALTEHDTAEPNSRLSTGLKHLTDLGITHVHLLPSFDFASIDETTLHRNGYNWGYDPQNYNVPEGSYATNPYDPYSRIREFKQMVQALHKAGIRVILDVVYNHTFTTGNSPFERTVPGYFYRRDEDGAFADGSACGNEAASERAMMRKYMIESVLYWAGEYHIDGFRFDLMGIHDIETMNEIRKAVDKIDPTICIYGEGWAAKTPKYPAAQLAMKGHATQMPRIAVFSDELRDGLRGPYNDNTQGLFLAGIPGGEESIKFGIAGAIKHPQIDYTKVNYTDSAWALQPTQTICYASCHDDMCLTDRLKASVPDLTDEQLIRLHMLAQTVVLTSQGIPFLFAGEEILRDKKGVHNSFKSPDAVNAIDWTGKAHFHAVYTYYQTLIKLRKNHPAFRMGDADLIRKNLTFLPIQEDNVIAYTLNNNANGDPWNTILVAFNARPETVTLDVHPGKYTIVCADGKIDEDGLGQITAEPQILLPPQSALIMYMQ